MDNNAYKYFVHCLPKTGDATIRELLSVFEDAERIFLAAKSMAPEFKQIMGKARLEEIEFFTKHWDLEREYQSLSEAKIYFVPQDDAMYPTRLWDIKLPPYAIYYKGSLPKDDEPAVAIIGARNCSEYGTFVADAFGEAMALNGVNVISGMARGIDGISQRGALKKNGRTYAVLGNGVDICYPECNIKLYHEIQDNGGIISAFPPKEQPKKSNFPQRNKLVAALSDVVIVVEARQKSGTSITVNLAMDMNRDIYAVPGRLTDRLSDGCNKLIRDGAGIALSPEDVIRELAVLWGTKMPESNALDANRIGKLDTKRPAPYQGVIKYLDFKPRSVEEIQKKREADEAGISLQQTMSELVMLCMAGEAGQVGSGYFYKLGKSYCES